MGLFGLKKKSELGETTAQTMPRRPISGTKAPVAAVLNPRLGLAVTDENPTLSTRLVFERRAVRDTLFKLIVSEATITNYKSYKGCAVEASRKDGRFTTKVLHDFGSGDTKVDLQVEEKRTNEKFTAKYIASVQKPAEGFCEASATSGPNKLTATHMLAKNLSALTASHEEVRDDGLYTALAAVNSDQAVRLALSKKTVKNGSTDTYTVSCVLPDLASASWKHDSITVSATAPITPSGVGTARVMMVWDPTFSI